jgi:hypothetical protein
MKRITYMNLILGIWLIVTPVVFGAFASNRIAAGSDIALGALLIASSWWIVAATTAQLAVSSFQLLCGIWLIVAPFVLGYRGYAAEAQNDLIVGILVAIVSVAETWTLWRAPLKTVH